MSHGFSIIVCAYNPDMFIFKRVLNALGMICVEKNNTPFEIIIVDNNSSPALSERPEVAEFLTNNNTTQLIIERNPGLTSARIAGSKQAVNDWIIFFDDDNEPAPDYLTKASVIISQYPKAGVWGPGKVNVEFIGNVSPFARSHKDIFQERNMSETIIDNVTWGQAAYPFGTGMIVRKPILDEYIRLVENGSYTMSDRIGKSLISGGDMQILLTGIKMGFYAGSSSDLRLNHLIKEEKTRFKKMLQLVFMLSASAVKLYNEVFDDAPHRVVRISNKYVLKTIYTNYRIYFFKMPHREFLLLLSTRLGEMYAHIIASSNQKAPTSLKLFQKIIFYKVFDGNGF